MAIYITKKRKSTTQKSKREKGLLFFKGCSQKFLCLHEFFFHMLPRWGFTSGCRSSSPALLAPLESLLSVCFYSSDSQIYFSPLRSFSRRIVLHPYQNSAAPTSIQHTPNQTLHLYSESWCPGNTPILARVLLGCPSSLTASHLVAFYLLFY